VKLKPLLTGMLTRVVPALRRVRGGGGTASASYCYEVWVKHLAMLAAGGSCGVPRTVLEVGPGDSLGTGLAALLSGASRYIATDAVRRTDPARDAALLDELAGLLRRRAPRPRKGWPDYDALLDAGLFPGSTLTDSHLEQALAVPRVAAIREALAGRPNEFGIRIEYIAPLTHHVPVAPASVDLVLSHAVLQHVVDLEGCYEQWREWLKPGGRVSCQVDFSGSSLFRHWNGYWACGERTWRLLQGRRAYLLNRAPVSAHLDLLRGNGFELTRLLKRRGGNGIDRRQLAPAWRHLSDDDLACSGVFYQAVLSADG
jgi:SAM-dependent methyltransferase